MRSKTGSGRTVLEIAIRIAVLVLLVSPFSSGALGQSLRQVAKFDLPGPAGKRFDYLTTDDEDQFLLSAHLGPGILYVIDMKTNKVVKAIPGVPGITGLEFVPETRKVYTSDWGEEKIGIVDLHFDDSSQALSNRGQAEREHVCRSFSQGLCLEYFGEGSRGRGRRQR